MSHNSIQIIAFYEFKDLESVGPLQEIRSALRSLMREHDIKGTIILASEGYNATVCGSRGAIPGFVNEAESLLQTKIVYKSSFYENTPFRRIDVKVKSEIVTLKKPVDLTKGNGTHVPPEKWNDIITDPDVFVLDTRNDYEYKSGTFVSAVNPGTSKFSELPEYVEQNLDPEKHKRIAMFCTGGIRCEKFAPYMKELGFDEVFQLEGGILKYLETIPKEMQLWQGECFVFDDRITVDPELKKGSSQDHSQSRDSNK